MNIKGKIPAFIFLTVYLFTSSAVTELFKLRALAGHFYDHREENRSVTLSTFLVQHYLLEDGTDADTAEDNKLPFKSFENNSSVSFISLSPPNLSACMTIVKEEVCHVFAAYKNQFLPSQYLSTIWQPPRNCYSV